MIGLGDLLGVVPTYFLSQFQFYGWGCQKKRKYLNLDVKNNLAGNHWRCSKGLQSWGWGKAAELIGVIVKAPHITNTHWTSSPIAIGWRQNN
jgi:hypothetical protein